MNAISKLIPGLALTLSLAAGCASAQGTRSVAQVGALRGAVVVDGPSVRAVVVGPSIIHAYSAYAGGSIYTAPAVSGTDSDCRLGSAGKPSHISTLAPDRIAAFEVAAGHVACLSTGRNGSFELLWHASREPAKSTVVATTLASE